MKRLEPAVYVVLAVLVGTLVTTIAFFMESADSWGLEGRRASGFLLIYGLALAGGFAVQAVFAVALRWAAGAARITSPASWAVLGGGLGVAIPWVFARAGYLIEATRFPAELQPVKPKLMFPLLGAMMFHVQPAWVQVLAGAVTGAALCLLARALSRWRNPGRP